MTTVSNSSYTSVEDSVVLAFESLNLGITAYWSNNNGVEPQTTYCELTILSDDALSSATESLWVNATTRVQTLSIPYQTTVRFAFIGKNKQSGGSNTNAPNIAKTFEGLMRFANTRLKFADNGLSVIKIGKLVQVPMMRDNNIFSITGIDITFGYSHTITMVDDTIDAFDVDGVVQYRLVEAYHNGYGMSYGYNYGQQNTTSTIEDIGVSLSLP
jgi:hypothetical protein